MALFASLDGKFDGLLGYFLAHEGTMAAKVPRIGKAISAAQVAVMGNMETERFEDRFFGKCIGYGKVWRKKEACLLQFL